MVTGRKESVMGDLISVSAGAIIFALLLLYVPACERV